MPNGINGFKWPNVLQGLAITLIAAFVIGNTGMMLKTYAYINAGSRCTQVECQQLGEAVNRLEDELSNKPPQWLLKQIDELRSDIKDLRLEVLKNRSLINGGK